MLSTQAIVKALSPHSKRPLCCPSCSGVLIDGDGNNNNINKVAAIIPSSKYQNIVSLQHKQCTNNSNPRKLFVCLGCGSRTNQTEGRLKNRYCRCSKVQSTTSNSAAAETATSDSNADECRACPPTEEVDDAEAGGDCDWSDSSPNDGAGGGSTPPPQPQPEPEYNIRETLDNDCEYPATMGTFFYRESQREGDGPRGLIYNALIDPQRETNFEGLSDKEMYEHLHIASVYHGMNQSKARDVCEMTANIKSHCAQRRTAETNQLREAFQESIRDAMCATGGMSDTQLDRMTAIVKDQVDKRMEEYYAEEDRRQKINYPNNYNDIRPSYVEGPTSVIKRGPMPPVGILHGCAHIKAAHIVNFFLGHGLECRQYRAGFEEDWVDADGNYECTFIKDLHERVKKLMNDNPDISVHALVLLIRPWSDGFVANLIKGTNDFNNLQMFTLTMLAPPGKNSRRHTLPFALCFKKKSHQDIFRQLLMEIRELEKPALRYFGRDRKVHQTMIFTELSSHDYIERCALTYSLPKWVLTLTGGAIPVCTTTV